MPELVGAAELLELPSDTDGAAALRTTLSCVEAGQLVVFGRSYAVALARWPELFAAVERRRADQRARTLTLAVIGHLSQVEVRILALLHHLAERWGRVLPEGTHVPFRLTHAAIGGFVRARRPTVTLALQQLRDNRLVDRLPDSTFLLLPGADAALEAMLTPDAPPSPVQLRARVSIAESRAAIARARTASEQAASRISDTQALLAESRQLVRRVHQQG